MSSGSVVAVLAGIGSSVLAFLCAPAIAFAQATASAATPLTFGVTLSATQRANETATYSFAAEQRHTYLIEVEQQSLDLIVTVERPDGASEAFNSPARREGDELVLLELTNPGTHIVTLRWGEHTGAVGGHTIRVSAIAEAAANPLELAALRLMSEGAALNREGGQAAWADASNRYLAAAGIWKMLAHPRREAEAKFSAAVIAYLRTRDRPRAVELAAEAANLHAELGDEASAANANSLQASALRAIPGSAAEKEAHYARALPLFTQAAEALSRLGRLYDLGMTQNQIGLLYHSKGDWQTARRYLTEAATSLRNANEWSGELAAVANLASVDFEEGYVETAIEGLKHALELMPPSGNPLDRAETLANLGVMRTVFGRYDEAIRTFSDSLALGEQLESNFVIGKSLSGIGETYYSMGELELAGDYLRAALPKRRVAADQRGQMSTLRYLGSVEYSQANYAAALESHQQALTLATAPADKALVQVLLAQDLVALGRYVEAAQIASTARDTAEAAGSLQTRADALGQLGRVRLADGHPREAAQFFEQALEVYSAQQLHGEQAHALNGLALAARETGDLQLAVDYGERALSHIENVRGGIADPRLRAFYLATRHDYYDQQIDLTMQLHTHSASAADLADAAFVLSERSRARSLVDLLREARVELDEPNPELASRRERLYASLDELRVQRDLRVDRAGAAADGSLGTIVDALAKTENELNRLETEARAANPRRASLTAPQPLSAVELRAALDDGSVLIEYALGEDRSYVMVVTREQVRVVALADRRTIEEAATRVYDGLRTSNGNSALTQDLRRLADLVLKPVAPLLTKDRLLIAADGALQYVPFAVLPVVGADGAAQPLIATHEVVGLPSLSVLVSLRAGARGAAPSKTVAVFADPVFDRADPRIAFADAAPLVHSAQAQLATRSSALTGTLARLPFTALEAQAIESLVPESERYVAVGFKASRETLFGLALDDYRIIHFATHGVIDTRYPDLSGLALSGFDAAGTPTRGLLGLPDIYALDLNADLVVLSACETAVGREIRGEGLLGLTQGFLYAGAKGVVASLWRVPDRATSELMQRFYDHLLRDGLRPADALRQAQLSIAAEPRWSDPYYWSAFVLLGDWR
ncbi:MAG TPA: CHAT domain-containing protein [Gammaproteobacteria bacterium]|nr:CHAT domain-containing protein [Gammaproteobacteria bacterium]